MRVPATRTEPSHLKSLSSPHESLCHVSLSCHVRMRKGERKWERERRRRGKEEEREIQRRKKRGEKEGSALSRSCIPRSWKTYCLGCTHTDSGGCVANVKYRRSDSVEWACTSKRFSSRTANSSGPSPSAGRNEREIERETYLFYRAIGDATLSAESISLWSRTSSRSFRVHFRLAYSFVLDRRSNNRSHFCVELNTIPQSFGIERYHEREARRVKWILFKNPLM